MQKDANALRRALLLYCNRCFPSLSRGPSFCQSQQASCCTHNSCSPISSTAQVAKIFSNLWVRGFSSFPVIDSPDQYEEPSSSFASDSEAEPKTTKFNGSKKSQKSWRQGGDSSNDRRIRGKTQNRKKDSNWREWKVKEKDNDKGRVTFSRNKDAVKKTLGSVHIKQQSKQKQVEEEKAKGTLKSKMSKKKLKAVMVDEDEEEVDDDIPFEKDESIEKWFSPLSAEEKEQRTQDLEKAFLEVSGTDAQEAANSIQSGKKRAMIDASKVASLWDKAYRARVDEENGMSVVGIAGDSDIEEKEEEEMENSGEVHEASDQWVSPISPEEQQRRTLELHRALLEISLGRADDEDDVSEDHNGVRKEDQRSLSVGIIGAPNAGKSTLTNFMVGTKVSAVSRKTNTTNHEILGVLTKDNTQILFFDTPGLALRSDGVPYNNDIRQRVESCWKNIQLYDLLVVLIDVHRHIQRPDPRVIKLVETTGEKEHPHQKRILCLNKVDLVEKKKDLLTAASEFGKLAGYDKFFMISGEKGSGVQDLINYLMDRAVRRPWDEDPLTMDEEHVKHLSYEVVREKMLDCLHQEIPYAMDHQIIDLKYMEDGSLRIEHHFIVNKVGHRKIIVGKNGSKIRQIGMAANEELRKLLSRTVHLIIQVRVKN